MPAAPPPRKPPGQIYSGPAPGSEAFAARRAQQAGIVSDRERKVAMLCHLSGLVGCAVPFGNVVVPLVIWLAGRKDSTFVDEHGKAAVNFQIGVGLAELLLFLLLFVPIVQLGAVPGFLILALLAVLRVIMVAVAANRGEDAAYGFGMELIK